MWYEHVLKWSIFIRGGGGKSVEQWSLWECHSWWGIGIIRGGGAIPGYYIYMYIYTRTTTALMYSLRTTATKSTSTTTFHNSFLARSLEKLHTCVLPPRVDIVQETSALDSKVGKNTKIVKFAMQLPFVWFSESEPTHPPPPVLACI